jgi:hypothetical protein
MHQARLASLSIVVTALLIGDSAAQTAYPMLMSVKPVAVQVGKSAELTISSRYTMAGAYQVLISGEGVLGEVLPSEAKPTDPAKKATMEKTKIKVTASDKALPGVRDVRLATPQGVSTVGQLVIVRDPVVVETGANDKPEQAQLIELPSAICGTIEKNEDVDYYKFHAEAGQPFVFRVRCARLEDRIHDLQTHADPIVTLRTATGATLATSDNNEYYADPVLAYRFEQAGDYLLEIRDVRYQGNAYWEYCIEANSRPLIECVFPLAATAGAKPSFQLLGELVAAGAAAECQVPKKLAAGIHWLELTLDGERTNPAPVIVAEVPLTQESSAENDIL